MHKINSFKKNTFKKDVPFFLLFTLIALLSLTGCQKSTNDIDLPDFYNITTIPVIETDDELSEEYLPYIIRGLCELRLNAMQQSEELLSQQNIEDMSTDEWLLKADENLLLWKKLDTYSNKFKESLSEMKPAQNSNDFNILALFKAPVAKAYTSEEIVALYDQASKIDRNNRLKLLADHLGVTAKDAFAIMQKCTEQIAKSEESKAEKLEIAERGLKLLKIAGQVSQVGLTISTGGLSSLVTGSAAIISGSDMILSIASDASFVAFGDNPTVKSIVAPIDKLRDKLSPVTGIASMMSFSLDTSNIQKKTELAINSFNITTDAFQGKFCGIDFSTKKEDEPTATVSKLEAQDLDTYAKEKGIGLNTKGLDNSGDDYSNLSTDIFLAQVEKRQAEFKENQEILKNNLDKTLEEIEELMAYSESNTTDNDADLQNGDSSEPDNISADINESTELTGTEDSNTPDTHDAATSDNESSPDTVEVSSDNESTELTGTEDSNTPDAHDAATSVNESSPDPADVSSDTNTSEQNVDGTIESDQDAEEYINSDSSDNQSEYTSQTPTDSYTGTWSGTLTLLKNNTDWNKLSELMGEPIPSEEKTDYVQDLVIKLSVQNNNLVMTNKEASDTFSFDGEYITVISNDAESSTKFVIRAKLSSDSKTITGTAEMYIMNTLISKGSCSFKKK